MHDGPLPLIVGIGNEHRRDDRAGLDVVRGLRHSLQGRARLAECDDDLTRLLDLWEGADQVLLVDAVVTGSPPGTLCRIEVDGDRTLGTLGETSTHGVSLGTVVGLGRSLGRLPRRLTIYAIEAADLTVGTGLTDAVARGVAGLITRLSEEVPRLGSVGGPGRIAHA